MRLTVPLFATPPGDEALNQLIRQERRRREIGASVDDETPVEEPVDPRPVAARVGGSGDGGPKGEVDPPDPGAAINQAFRRFAGWG